MKAIHHQMNMISSPYDYRVAYFQRIGDSSSSGVFILPSIDEMLGATLGNDERTDLMEANFRYSVTVGLAPGVSTSGDFKFFGDTGWYGIGAYGEKWRPAGINIWGEQPTREQIPLVGGNSVKMDIVGSVLEFNDSEGNSFTHANNNNTIASSAALAVFYMGSDGGAYVRGGTRFFEASVVNDHPSYGFNAEYICVMKDDEPYIFDRVSGSFFPKLNEGDVYVGPKVNDKWDPLTWVEPS